MKKVTAIICGKNPNAEQMKEEIVRNFLPHFQLVTYITQKNTATQIAREAALNGTDVILAVGGDGTVNEVVNGVVKENTDITKLPAVAVIPFGTGNDLARTANLGRNYDKLIDKINRDDYSIIDLALAQYRNNDGETVKRFYVNIADIGLGPKVIAKAEVLAKKLPGTLSYLLAAIPSLIRPPKMTIRLSSDGFNYEGPASIMTIANGHYMGGGFGISPYSKLDDEILDIVIIKKLTITKFLFKISKIRQCKLVFADQITYRHATFCRLESISGDEIPIELDGELVGTTPLEVKIFASSLKLFADTK